MSATTPTTTASQRPAPATTPAPPVAVRPLTDPTLRAAWARYVDAHPGGTLFHHPDWADAVATAFRHRPQHLRATRNGQLVGVLPLMEVNSLLGGRMLVSMPYGNAGGILADDPETCAALAESVRSLAAEREARVVDLRSIAANAPGFDAVAGYCGFVRPLPLHPNELETYLPRKARAAARNARNRAGVTVRHDQKLLPLVWQLYCRSMRRIGSINYPLRFFKCLFDLLGERAWATVVYAHDRPVCGTVSLVFRDTVSPYIVGTDDRIRCDGATNLMYLAVMERAVRSSLRQFDFGRSRADNSGPYSFKKNQGFEPEPLGYQRYVPPGQRPTDLKPSNPRFARARQMWQHLPLPLTRVLGAWLARSIPG